MNHQVNDTDIAIIGMSGRFPGANNIETFWQNLRDGIESIAVFNAEEVRASGVPSELLERPNYVPVKAVIDDIDRFDASFFGFSPREAEILDPQQRLFLECAWSALESAGYVPETYDGIAGIFAGGGSSQYFLHNIFGNPQLSKLFSDYQLRLANDREFIATRTAYKLNLTGPAIVVQSACSTSLVAVHLACQSLLSGECDLALAGGVTLKPQPQIGYAYQEGMIFSPDGHCRAFDAQAQGTVGSQGVGIVALKRATEAIAEGDFIYALIKGSAINNDGSFKVGYTAPSIDGQAQAIAEAQAVADIDPETITYIEAHGTGTKLGDPIEIAALTQAFRQSTNKKGFCAIGSLKTNMGHLNHAAGVAGLIKTALALHHQQIPPSLHFENPNPQIDFANSPFYVNKNLSEWKTTHNPRRAGVSSFGIGGTNAHVVLEEAPRHQLTVNSQQLTARKHQLLLISAKTSSALATATENLVCHLKQHPEINLANVAYTLAVGRQAFEYRRRVVCSTADEAIALLDEANIQLTSGSAASDNPAIIFMFPGQGSQYVNMAREIYEREPVFRQEVDRCAELLKPELNLDLREVIYPATKAKEDWAIQQLKQTAIAQPALFTIEYALAQLWFSWGVRPQGFIGHSIGEYVAACLAGVFDLEDALALVAARGRMMQQLPTGDMLSVPLAAEVIQPWLNKDLSVAVINEPSRCVVSGTEAAIANFKSLLTSKGIESRYLHTSHAFHSAMMEPILEKFARQVEAVKPQTPTMPFVSNVTGNWITNKQAISSDYWSQHIRSTVQFARGIEQCLLEPEILLEVGPGRTLTTFVKRHPAKLANQKILNSLRHPKEAASDVEFCLKTLGQLWQAGVNVDWHSFYTDRACQRIPLPTYPFERQRYWIEPEKLAQPTPQTQVKADRDRWFYLPSWKRCPVAIDPSQNNAKSILLFGNAGIGTQLSDRLQQAGHRVIRVEMGETFAQKSNRQFICNPQQPKDYQLLLQALASLGEIPKSIVHCWSIDRCLDKNLTTVDRLLDRSFYSLLFLVQAYSKHGISDRLELWAISDRVQSVLGTEDINATAATMLGAVRVIPQEYTNWCCRSIDLDGSDGTNYVCSLEQLVTELSASAEDSIVAYRGRHRWVQTFDSVTLPKQTKTPLRDRGAYLITGGLGGIGLSLARYLAETVKAKLVLISRSPLSLQQGDTQSQAKIRQIEDLKELGAEVLVINADVADLEQMERAIAQSQAKFGQIQGVIHAAGQAAGGAIEFKTKPEVEKIFRAKIQGTLVLHQVLKDIQLDWWVLCSSLASIVGGFGQVDYCAANIFLDTFAHQSTASTKLLAINWDTWQQVGMAVETIEREQLTSKGTNRRLQRKLQHQLGLTPAEGVEVFGRAFSLPSSQIIVSTRDLAGRIAAKQQEIDARSPLPNSQKAVSVEQTNYSRPDLNTSYQPPTSSTEIAIANSWESTLGIEPIGIDDNFFELGGDSLTAVQIITNLRQSLATPISLNDLIDTATIAGLAAKIESRKRADRDSLSPCLVELRSGSSNVQPLFLVHSAGGSVFIYRDLMAHLNSERTVFGLQPSKEDITLQKDIKAMAASYIKAVKTVQPKGAYCLGGHSFGGIVALEMAQQLKAQGEKVELLAVIDSSLEAKQKIELNTQTDLLTFLLDMGEKQPKHRPILEKKTSEEQLNYFLQHQNSAATLKNPDKTLLLDFLQIFKLNHQAIAQYQADCYRGKVAFFKAQTADAITDPNSERGWLKLTDKQSLIHTVTGNHLTMLDGDNAIALAEILQQYI